MSPTKTKITQQTSVSKNSKSGTGDGNTNSISRRSCKMTSKIGSSKKKAAAVKTSQDGDKKKIQKKLAKNKKLQQGDQ